MEKETFGDALRRVRLARKLGLRRFSELAEIDAGNLSRMERGKLKPPAHEEVLRLARMLKLEESDRNELIDLARAERISFQVGKPLEGYIKRKGPLIPLMLRSIHDKNLSEEQIQELIDHINDL